LKKLLIPITFLLVCAFIITGCTSATTTATTKPPVTSAPAVTTAAPVTSAPAVTTAAPVPTTTKPSPTATTVQPLKGGILRIIANAGPQVLGGFEGGPSDAGAVFPAVQCLMDAIKDRSKGSGLEPVLAESVDDDIPNKRIVFHIRPNVKFSDGSPLNADVVVWTVQRMIDAGRLQYASYFKGIKKLDDMTVEMSYTQYTNQLLPSWGWMSMRSKVAYEQGSGGDAAKGKQWDRDHVVGTGPFVLQEFVKDDHLYWARNPNYWQPGLPLLDGIQVQYIPDPMTAQNKMLAGQADQWEGAPAQNQQYMVSQGSIRATGWCGLPTSIWPNTADPNSKFQNIKLRQALEYALDKPTLAKALGFGYYVPMSQLAPAGEWGYDPNYQTRAYDPAKAKALLAEAGFPNGLNVTMLVANDQASVDTGTAVKQYLDKVGINVSLDQADPGRFYGTVFGKTVPKQDLSIMWSGMDTNYLMTYMRWFSTDPFTWLAFFGRTPEQQTLDIAAQAAPDAASQKAQALIVYGYINNNARIVPLWNNPSAIVTAKYVHNEDRFAAGFVRWQSELVWMDKH
jgi:peptide/nickel transport system substrate-binding protein